MEEGRRGRAGGGRSSERCSKGARRRGGGGRRDPGNVGAGEVRERKRRFRIAIPPRHWLRFRANVKREPPVHSRAARGTQGVGAGREGGEDFRDGRCRSAVLPSPRPLIDNIRSCMILLRVSQWPSGQARSTSIYVPGAPNYRRPESAVDNE